MSTSRYRFGPYELRPAERMLLRDGVPLHLRARGFDVLLALIEQQGAVVSKPQLLDRVWAGVVVEDNNLTVQITALRKLLGSRAIATVTGRGYRWNWPLTVLHAEAQPFVRHAYTAPGPQRRLCAVLGGDGPAWPRLVERDAACALQRWVRMREDIIEPAWSSWHGRVIEVAPQHLLCGFDSLQAALECGLHIQALIAARRGTRERGRAFALRLALSVDELVIDANGQMAGSALLVMPQLLRSARPGDLLIDGLAHALLAGRADLSCERRPWRGAAPGGRFEPVFRVRRRAAAGAALAAAPTS